MSDSAENAKLFEEFIHAETMPAHAPDLPPEIERRLRAVEDTMQRMAFTLRRQETLLQGMKLEISGLPALVDQLRDVIAQQVAAKNLARDGHQPP